MLFIRIYVPKWIWRYFCKMQWRHHTCSHNTACFCHCFPCYKDASIARIFRVVLIVFLPCSSSSSLLFIHTFLVLPFFLSVLSLDLPTIPPSYLASAHPNSALSPLPQRSPSPKSGLSFFCSPFLCLLPIYRVSNRTVCLFCSLYRLF